MTNTDFERASLSLLVFPILGDDNSIYSTVQSKIQESTSILVFLSYSTSAGPSGGFPLKLSYNKSVGSFPSPCTQATATFFLDSWNRVLTDMSISILVENIQPERYLKLRAHYSSVKAFQWLRPYH